MPINNPAAGEFVRQLQQAQQLARQHMTKAQQRYQTTSNQHRREQQHAIGDRVLLSNEHLPVPGQGLSRKLREVWNGPFQVLEKMGAVNYRLSLPPSMKVHPVFHVSRLRPYVEPNLGFPNRQTQPVPPIVIDREEETEVEAILGQHKRGQRTHFLVKWRGYPTS